MNKEEFLKDAMHGERGISDVDADVLYDALIDLPEEGRMVDAATGWGTTVKLFALLKPKWVIYTIDVFGIVPREVEDLEGDRNFNLHNIKIMHQHWHNRGIKNIVSIIADSASIPWEFPINAVFIDGDHSYESVKADFEKFSPFVVDGGVIAFHDWHIKRYKVEVWKFLDEIEEKHGYEIERREGANVAVLKWNKKT